MASSAHPVLGFLILPVWTPAAVAIAGFGVLQMSKGLGEWLGSDGGGKNLAFGKFATDPNAWAISSKDGMLLWNGTGLLSSIAGCYYLSSMLGHAQLLNALTSLPGVLAAPRALLLAVLLLLHYLRRVFEVLAVHKFTSSMEAPVAIEQALMTLVYIVQIIWSAHKVPTHLYTSTAMQTLVPGLGLVPLMPFVGCCLFALGELGCLYHHYLLRSLRQGASQAFAIPQGGAFSVLVCPHYLCELLSWWGMAVASQHLQSYIVAAGLSSFLLGRSVATKSWYLKKFDNFPASRL